MPSLADDIDLISIHALREEGDVHPGRPGGDSADFYPRPPRGGRQFAQGHVASTKCISIHALREEGDVSSSMLQM